MKKTFFAIFVLIISLSSCSEADPVYIYGNIVGRVTEEGSNIAIEGATVEISGVEQSVKTGSNGMFKFETLPADNYTIYVSKDGYVADSKIITVVATKTTQSDFSLQKNLPEATPSEVSLTTTSTSASVELTNTRSVDMNFAVQTSQSWISVSPSNGTIASKNKKIIKISADYSTIDYGDYSESVVINVGQSSLTIPIQISYYRPSYIEITSPESGKVYSMGNVLPISWESNVGGTVRIELVRNGNVQQSIAPSVDNHSTGNHNWGIPSLAVDAYQVRITSNESPNVYGTSGVFYLQDGPTPPVVSTGTVTSITSSAIIIEGSIEDLGKTYTSITQYGHVYSETNPSPTISDYKLNLGSTNQLVTYNSNITNLKPNTRYYIRAYAENPKGIAYGSTVSVTTKTADGKDPWSPTEPDETGAVDLGLSVKWAAYNIGASQPEEYGEYYAWGEVEPKADYTQETYLHARPNPLGYGYYVYELPDGLNDISGTKFDAATVKWGNGWRLPTKLELIELVDNTTVVYTSYNNIKGARFIGPNGNCIFVPFAGARDENGKHERGGINYLWSSEAEDNWHYSQSYCLKWEDVYHQYAYWGMPIRAVRGK